MIVLDRLLVGSIRFVLDKVVQAVEAEQNDEQRLREDLLAAQMRLELGEIDEAGFAAIEADLLPRLRAIREAQRAEQVGEGEGGRITVTGAEASVRVGHEK